MSYRSLACSLLLATVVACISGGPASAAVGSPLFLQKLVSPSGGADDHFGMSVAFLGDQLFVGAPDDDTAGLDTGAVYVYERSAGTWTQVDRLLPGDADAGQRFGWALEVDSLQLDTLVIGSIGDGDVSPNRGSAYVFLRDGKGDWHESQKLAPANLVGASLLGYSAALDGDTLIVAAPLESNDIGSMAGSAFVFERDAGGTWKEKQKLLPQEGETPGFAFFGASVDLDGDLAVVGVPYQGVGFFYGWVEVFARRPTGWQQELRFHGDPFTGRDRFGYSVQLLGDVIVAGSPRMPPPPNGVVQSFRRLLAVSEPPTWEPIESFPSADPLYNDQFGHQVVIAGDLLLAGAVNHDGRGAAFLYDFTGQQASQARTLLAPDSEEGDRFGVSLAMQGGLIAVGATEQDSPEPSGGSVYLFQISDAAGRAGSLLAGKADSGQITLSWGSSCLAMDGDYAIYQGILGDFTSHESLTCSTGGATTETFAPAAGNAYYLVVPLNATREGSYGTDSAGLERPPGATPCLPQLVETCP